METEVKETEIKRPEIIPGEEILPDVDIPLVISNLCRYCRGLRCTGSADGRNRKNIFR